MNYVENRAWSDRFIPEITRIVGPYLMGPASVELDTKQATDLIVLRAKDMRIAARVRREGYAERYPFEFTIRARSAYGKETELHKIVSGWGDWMFYGHASGESNIARWMLIDLHRVRAELIWDGFRPTRRLPDVNRPKMNGDGTGFIPFDIRDFPPNTLIACSYQFQREFAA